MNGSTNAALDSARNARRADETQLFEFRIEEKGGRPAGGISEPGLQRYTVQLHGSSGKPNCITSYRGFALDAQRFPDSARP